MNFGQLGGEIGGTEGRGSSVSTLPNMGQSQALLLMRVTNSTADHHHHYEKKICL